MSTQSPQVAQSGDTVILECWMLKKITLSVDDLPIEVANGWGQTWMVDIFFLDNLPNAKTVPLVN